MGDDIADYLLMLAVGVLVAVATHNPLLGSAATLALLVLRSNKQ